MTLIQSVSGIRGTIGGVPGQNLTPPDMVKFATGYAQWLTQRYPNQNIHVILGRDARPSGPSLANMVAHTLAFCGIQVTDLGLSTTPTVEMAVPAYKAQGGIILTASHNPVEWNALKLLNEKGEFLSAADGQALMELVQQGGNPYVDVAQLGSVKLADAFIDEHVDQIVQHPFVLQESIAAANFSVSINGVHSSGGVALPILLKALGVNQIHNPYGTPTGRFPHNPEPLPEHLEGYCRQVKESGADVGFVVDPDVDRLAIVCEDGSFFGEEYTLVAMADYLLAKRPGPVVSNLSSSRALADVAAWHGCERFTSAVGEVHVVQKMKEVGAVLGGEGNGGVIFPDLHYGRDALIGVALFLSFIAETGLKPTQIRAKYPAYAMSKRKVNLEGKTPADEVLQQLTSQYAQEDIQTIDGLWINRGNAWVHVRKSNTEPILRIYTEAPNQEMADNLAEEMLNHIQQLSPSKV